MTLRRRLAWGALVIGLCLLGTVGAAALGWSWRSVPPGPCRQSPTIAEAKRWMYVFEGIVVDHWDETFLDNTWRVRRLRTYRFQVVRNWSSARRGGRGPELVHGWYEGEPYMRGTYRSFERGRRYLVAATTHDSPGHTFTTSCFPGAEGEAIEAMAADLGPPRVTFEPEPLPDVPWWLPAAREARNVARFSIMLGYAAGRSMGF